MITMFQITPIPAFEDNYIWTLCQPQNKRCLIVDPGESAKVLEFLTAHQLQLDTILITHHHADHTGGIIALKQHYPNVNVIGPATEQHRIPGLTQTVSDGDRIDLAAFDLAFEVIAVPGHTLGHIAYYSAPVLFCGDTLFSAGCGRLFEGTPEQMWHSLCKLSALADDTQIYCTHEYTISNLKFALSAEPTNAALVEYAGQCARLRKKNAPTLPSILKTEKLVNPFLRCDNKALQQRWQQDSSLGLFTALRAAKDQFKG